MEIQIFYWNDYDLAYIFMVDSYSGKVIKDYTGSSSDDVLPMVLSWLKDYTLDDFKEYSVSFDIGYKYYNREEYNKIDKDVLCDYLFNNKIND